VILNLEKVSSDTPVISIAAVSSDTPIDLINKDQVILNIKEVSCATSFCKNETKDQIKKALNPPMC